MKDFTAGRDQSADRRQSVVEPAARRSTNGASLLSTLQPLEHTANAQYTAPAPQKRPPSLPQSLSACRLLPQPRQPSTASSRPLLHSGSMLRRHARLRKEYLYRKSLEGKERELYEKKRKIRQALEGGCRRHGGRQALARARCGQLRAGRLPVAPNGPDEGRQADAPCAALHAEGKPIPNELRREEAELRHQVSVAPRALLTPPRPLEQHSASALAPTAPRPPTIIPASCI